MDEEGDEVSRVDWVEPWDGEWLHRFDSYQPDLPILHALYLAPPTFSKHDPVG